MSILDPSYMIDLGGIDVIQSQGVVIPGLYQKLLDNIGPCGNPLIYNWKFNGVFIPPQYVEPILEDDAIYINDIYVSSDDVVHIPSIEIQPNIVQLNVSENGEYEAPEGIDGYNPVVVDVEEEVSLLTSAQWDALTTQEKQAYGLVAIQTTNSGYIRGQLVNGADYVPLPVITQQGYKKANAGAVTPTITATANQLLVIALNTEATSYQMNTTVTHNGNTMTEDWIEYHQYVSSGTNRRNYRISVYSGTFSPNDSLSISVTNYGNYSLVIYALLDEASLTSFENAITTDDAVASGSYADAIFVLYGIDSGSSSANIEGLLYNDGSLVTTANPGSSYSAGFIFWFNSI